MERPKDPMLIEGPHDFEARDGIMYIYRDGECRTAMRICTFTAFVNDGMRAIADWQRNESARVVAIRRGKAGARH